MSEYANDVKETSDIEVDSGNRWYRFEFGGGESPKLTPAQRETLRAASGSWATLRTAWAAMHTTAGPWLDGLPGSVKEALRVTASRPLIP